MSKFTHAIAQQTLNAHQFMHMQQHTLISHIGDFRLFDTLVYKYSVICQLLDILKKVISVLVVRFIYYLCICDIKMQASCFFK